MQVLMNKEQLQEELRTGIFTVVFEKVDGTLRTMRCTLQPQYLTETTILGNKEETGLSRGNPQVLAVWDLTEKGWRSFRINSLLSIEKDH